MKDALKKEIEEYVSDWHWDDDSQKYAFELGVFLYSFINYLEDQKLSRRTKDKHIDNIYWIGSFEVGYGYNDEFFPENLEDGPAYEYEFERKISDSVHAMKSYESTWRKLDQYIKSGVYEKYLKDLKE